MRKSRIGIISGVFDPVHIGHIKLAQRAKADLNLDEIYFLCEEKPRAKKPEVSFEQRQKMLELVAKEFKFGVLNLSSKTFSVSDLSLISAQFNNDQTYLVMGSDAYRQASSWFNPEQSLRGDINLVGYDRSQIAESISSGSIRLSIKKQDYSNLPALVASFIRLNKLYKF
jgi:nicotinate-nucleotide adenylyltransferase